MYLFSCSNYKIKMLWCEMMFSFSYSTCVCKLCLHLPLNASKERFSQLIAWLYRCTLYNYYYYSYLYIIQFICASDGTFTLFQIDRKGWKYSCFKDLCTKVIWELNWQYEDWQNWIISIKCRFDYIEWLILVNERCLFALFSGIYQSFQKKSQIII